VEASLRSAMGTTIVSNCDCRSGPNVAALGREPLTENAFISSCTSFAGAGVSGTRRRSPDRRYGGDLKSCRSRGMLSPMTRRIDFFFLLAGLGWFLSGCAAVPVQEQRLVSKPNMQFSRSTIYFYDARLLVQAQQGRFSNGGAQASTCTLCR